jgi:aspartate/methionine/tyrosine aminotransferase
MATNRVLTPFSSREVKLDILRERAFNYRWAEVDEDIIPLTAADPDFPVAPEIIESINQYVSSGFFSYGPPAGLPVFRDAISEWYQTTKGITFHPETILPVNSAAYGLFLAAQSTLKKGDKAIILEPVDFLFRKAIENAGAEVIVSKLNKETGQTDITELISLIDPHVKAIFICNPNNPLGKVMVEEDLMRIGQIALAHNLWIISDEIWADIVFGKKFCSIASICAEARNRIITISGLSKNFGLAGLRIGYVCTSDKIIFQRMYEVSQSATTANGISTLSQIAGTAALTKAHYWLDDFHAHLAEMREYVEQRLNNIEQFESNHPDATYLFFPKLKGVKMNSRQMCTYLMEHAKVALVPGGKNWFEQSSEGHVRICYATSKPILKEAFDRIEDAVKRIE